MTPKHRHLPSFRTWTLAATSLILFFAPAQGARAQSAATNPFTYLGRVMDSSHKAFDEDRSATVSAYGPDGKELAKAETFFREGSRNNYRLTIPLADGEADGYATTDAILTVSVKDNEGKTWSGVVVDEGQASGTAVGAPGGVREVDIVLGEDNDGDGIDDTLFKRLNDEWKGTLYSLGSNGAFDPHDDHDGDGVSTLDEALAGTEPFNPDSVLQITAFEMDTDAMGRHVLTFSPTMPGHAYVVQTANSPTGTWSSVSFQLPDSETPVNVISRPTKPDMDEPATVYLLPSDKPSAFFRVKLDGDTTTAE